MSDTLSEQKDVRRLHLTGRIDSITCREIESLFRDAVMAGKRLIVADMTGVTYVSSAGLRIFLSFQKELKKAGGEICLFNSPDPVYSIFELSGFTNIFRFLSSEDEIKRFIDASGEGVIVGEIPTEHALLRVLAKNVPAGSLSVTGSEDKLPSADYSESDICSIGASQIRFGTGLAALGNAFEDYKGYFGEAVVIDGNIFVYPALRRSAVDFIIHTEGPGDTLYHFLHGFSFQGEFNHIVSFEPKNSLFTLDELVDSTFRASSCPVVGITGIFESKGLFGMRLKKIPFRENRGPAETNIFSGESFPEWIDYSIEPEDMYNLVVMTGVAVKDRKSVRGKADRIIPREGRFHIHGVVFDKKPFNKVIDNFPNELKRVVTGMEPQRVLHLQGRTRVGPGLLGIVELEG
jgi:anti-anti-sigma factor